MATLDVKYARLTETSASSGGGETALLTPGTVGDDYEGNLLFTGNNLVVGSKSE